MDKCSSDAEFDSYWDSEAKNNNRNRIRVGRQYQATIPPLLKPGEKDARKCEDLETLKWKPDQISEQDIDSYLSMAKAVSSFARIIENYCGPDKPPENSLQTAIKGLTEFVTSHHPCHRDAGCKVPVSESSSSSSSNAEAASSSKTNALNSWTQPETRLFAQALETCGKNFCAIKKEFLPWKPVRSLIEYYYYFNCKGEKAELKEQSPKSVSPSPSEVKVEKVESIEPVASSSTMVETLDTKEEKPSPEPLKTEQTELPEVLPPKEEIEKKTSKCETPLPEQESNLAQTTVGCLKFFLGGRLVLKLNAQQESTTKCHWVQSHDTPRCSHQSKKMRHRKKSIQDVLPQNVSIVSPKQKKKHEEEGDNNNQKKAKLKTDTFPLLCSASWTPPVADGQDAAELDDASSKTSEGHDSPIVVPHRGIDHKRSEVVAEETKHDKKVLWSEPSIPCTSSEVYDEYSSRGSSMMSGKFSPDLSYSHEVLNHKSALTPSKVKNQSRTVHSGGSPKLYAKWSDTERQKCLPCFHSPTSISCHASPDNSNRDFVLDLSLKPGKTQDMRISYELCCYPNESCTENCNSSEESAEHCCGKLSSSNLGAYRSRVPPEASKSSLDCEDIPVTKTSEGFTDCTGQCLCCYNASASCASPKCCNSYSSKEHVCNKDCSPSNSPNSSTDGFAKNHPPWFGSSTSSVLQVYPQCYPYYVAYDNVNHSNSSPTETPLDLSNNEGAKRENNLSELNVDVPKNATGNRAQ